ncbi:helix-turn-helix transcriptional regulator [Rivularia sp. UHCC 0363]|uniref:helix-turn-helix transcriptional regulator n=1 Tax=Rivularia sp. UHCC 0363 TaxID=3110244 RepID=UPI002B1FF015|nr:helix-turn-helix transcriptional regulator [Rivularia sp. UHCC 0363]MEA5594870.1 helix-turn-helix transcriptional regulator [Rivularia sp. UHCC 0363]
MKLEGRKKLSEIARAARGSMSQRAFAKFLGVSFSTVQAWERGDSIPDIQNLAKIAQRAEYSIEELFGDLGIKPASQPSDLAVILRQLNKMPLTDVATIVQAGVARISAAAESIGNEAKVS